MNQFGRPSLLPPVVKNLLIINVLIYVATYYIFPDLEINLKEMMGLFYWESEFFKPWQFITYMFMHGDFTHILFNMFAVWMFGSTIENYWGSKRFLNYYLLTGFGAAILHYLIIHYQVAGLEPFIDESARQLALEGRYNPATLTPDLRKYLSLVAVPIVGASGSLFGILLAYGMSFPNSKIHLYFLFPIKAKYFVAGYGIMELVMGIQNNPGDNIAHFAHLGGMLFGYIMIRYWKKNDPTFY